MLWLISTTRWLITLIGFLTLGLVALRAMSKEDSPFVAVLQPIQTVAMKLAGVAVVFYVLIVTYYMTDGVLSIQTIGMYVACFGILLSLIKDMGAKSSLLSDVQAVVTHKAQKIQASLAEQAVEARKSKTSNQDVVS